MGGKNGGGQSAGKLLQSFKGKRMETQAAVLILPQIKLNSQLSCFAFFFKYTSL